MMKTNNPQGNSRLLASLSKEEYCYLTTTGRVSGRPHEIEIWFGLQGNSIYLLSGGGEGSDWVKNMHAAPSVRVRIGEHTFGGKARFIIGEEEELMARRMLAAKYQSWRQRRKLSNWAREALVVAVDLNPAA